MAAGRNRDENRRSGLSGMGKRYRFEGREAPEPWQAEALAEDHAANGRGRLVCSEGVGTGKSRRCSAVCVRLREEGRDAGYALRQESAPRAGGLVKDAGPYEALLRPRKTVGDQPIHGLPEAGKGQQPARRDEAPILGIPSARCQESRKRTSPSRERSMEELLESVEGAGSRVCEDSGLADRWLRICEDGREYCLPFRGRGTGG